MANTDQGRGDTTPPQLAQFDFEPKTVDVSLGPAEVTFAAHLTDDLSGVAGSGYTSSPTQARLRSPGGGQHIDVLFQSHVEIVAGTPLDGRYESIASIPQYAEQGTWKVDTFMLVDQVGNQVVS